MVCYLVGNISRRGAEARRGLLLCFRVLMERRESRFFVGNISRKVAEGLINMSSIGLAIDFLTKIE